MKNRFNFVASTGIALTTAATLLPSTSAHADLSFWSKALVGTWRHPRTGDTYRFKPNASYTFTAGRSTARSGQISHSGVWKIAQPTQRESGGSMEGPVALVLNSRTRTVLRSGRKVTLSSRRSFRLVVDVAFRGNEREVDANHYYIGRTKWVRVR